ncbi:PLP-dependent aminotransferase family protein [Peribacillus acanthi]|uniref:MocR-like pyridoxine biosynthesis transcription factor PdxR n=1 Tax=Peribacillus acanthi TaxID=2171554 RepID=UPI000D3EE0F2|nr:PLP-dependent aminotransferase family protein [Peribacillus acanthi]
MEEIGLPLNLYGKKYKYKYLALYHSLRDFILSGKLNDGFRLPSTRDMAKRYSLSRGIVNQVYEMLAADGYVHTKEGSGTFVTNPSITSFEKKEIVTPQYQLSSWGRRLPYDHDIKSSNGEKPALLVDFSNRDLPLQKFPIVEWKRAMKQGMNDLDYLLENEEPDPIGYPPLRQEIANHLNVSRGMNVSPDHIVIVNGSVHAMAILAHLLVDQGEEILLQNPSYVRLRNMIETVGGIPKAIPEENGMIKLDDMTSQVVYVTPSNQYPTGKVMNLEERLHLLQWASENNAVIIEDDIDSIFRRIGRPIEPLKVLDEEDRVVYLGTFAFTLLTPLRIGYAILPEKLLPHFLHAKYIFEPFSTGLLEQAAIAKFMGDGSYGRHIRKMRRLYNRRYTILRGLFDNYLPNAFTWSGSDTGMYLFGEWNHSKESYALFQKQCYNNGLIWSDPSRYFFEEMHPCAIFFFTDIEEKKMEEAVKLMGDIYNRIL